MLKRGKVMKKLSFALLSAAISISSCSSGRMASRGDYDDVYYSKSDAAVEDYGRIANERQQQQQQEPARAEDYTSTPPSNTYQGDGDNERAYSSDQQSGNSTGTGDDGSGGQNDRFRYNTDRQDDRADYSTTERRYSDDGETYVTNNYYYNDDDYYDYAYTSRVRRFYHPYGWSYYDPYYTNLYWYDYNPVSWGVSLYCTYNWWNPSPWSGWSGGFGWNSGWGGGWNSGWGWGGGWNNGWGWGGGYNNGYWNGYNNGYWDGYYAGLYNGTFNPYYFNSFDNHSYYYGPRGGRSSVANNTPRGGRNVGDLYGRSLTAENPK